MRQSQKLHKPSYNTPIKQETNKQIKNIPQAQLTLQSIVRIPNELV